METEVNPNKAEFHFSWEQTVYDLVVNDVDMVQLMAGCRGWHPPDVGGQMVVHFGDREYTIERTR